MEVVDNMRIMVFV